MLKEKKQSSKEYIVKSIKDFDEIISQNSIVAKPIVLDDNRTIIPVLKVTIGYLGGGGEYGEIKIFTKEKSHPFAGGSGALVSMNPCGFLVCSNDNVNFVKVDGDIADKVFEKTTEFVSKAVQSK